MIKLPNILLPSFNGVHKATFELLGWCLRPPTTIQNSKFKRPGCRFEGISGHGGCYCGHVRTPVGLLLPPGTSPHPLGNFVAAPAAPAPRHHPFTFKIQMPRSVSRRRFRGMHHLCVPYKLQMRPQRIRLRHANPIGCAKTIAAVADPPWPRPVAR